MQEVNTFSFKRLLCGTSSEAYIAYIVPNATVMCSHNTLVMKFVTNACTHSFEGMKTIIETHGDFFRDLELWLPDFFFTKLVKASLEVRACTCYSITVYRYLIL
jgi:hypothetical protein